MKKSDDYFCLKCLTQGDEEAFVTLYGKYCRMVYFSALKLTGSEDEAKDVTQTVFMKIWERRASIKPEEDFAAYIGVVSRNVIFDLFRKVAKEEEMKREMALQSSEEADDDETDIRESYYRLLHEAIDRLPPQRRRVYEACKLQGWSYDRVAAKMGCTLNTVHEHIILANKFVREYIQKYGDMFLVILTVVLGCK